jgi:hypothetical protein
LLLSPLLVLVLLVLVLPLPMPMLIWGVWGSW